MTPDPTLSAIEQRERAATAELARLTTGHPGTNWRWSIPANPDRDSDLILGASVADVPYLLGRLRATEAERDEAQRRAQRDAVLAVAADERAEKARRQLAAVRALLGRIHDDWVNMGEETYWDGHLLALAAAVGLDRVPRALDSPQDTPDAFLVPVENLRALHDWRFASDTPHQLRDVLRRLTTGMFPAQPQDTPDYGGMARDLIHALDPTTPQDPPDPHDGHPYAYADDCPDCETARWPVIPQDTPTRAVPMKRPDPHPERATTPDPQP